MKFLKGLFERSCSHRFTWPRTDAHGRHYQICPLCGTAYEYDWSAMRRTDRLLTADAEYRPFGGVDGSRETDPAPGLTIRSPNRPKSIPEQAPRRENNRS